MTSTSAPKKASTNMSYLIHHVFLPPKVPVESDYSPENEKFLLRTILESLEAYRSIVAHEQSEAVAAAVTMLQRMQDVHMCSADRYVVNEPALVRAFEQLDGHGGSIVLHIAAQNAGIIFTAVEDEILVEVFEVSPTNNSVISTRGRLRRTFPASAVYIPCSVLQDGSFRVAIASTLAKMSHQRVKDTQPKARKAAHAHDEDRDTTHPKVVTEFLISVLAPLGRRAEVSAIWKNTRDEVFYQSSLQPWRRSPLWLVIRVALQLKSTRYNPADPDHFYKEFMIFTMARVLSNARDCEYHSDFLMAMSAKIRQRLLKFKAICGVIEDMVRCTLRDTDRMLETKWNKIQDLETQSPPLEKLQQCNFKQDTLVSVPGLDQFIENLGARKPSQSCVDFAPTTKLPGYKSHQLPSLENAAGDQLRFELIAFEAWVAENLTSWLDLHINDACGQLRDLIEHYHQLAEPAYSSDPESTSLMILTILELWVGCDKAAVTASPLLQEYDPGIDSALFQNLLLRSRHQMDRLLDLEKYLEKRTKRSTHPSCDVFRAFGTQDSFSVKHYQLSSEHQDLMNSIERRAAKCREEKEDEFRQKKGRYKRLMSDYGNASCHLVEEWSDWDERIIEKHYASRCAKCGYLRDAEAISIQVHEWPLPHNRLEAYSTVFELLVPSFFGHWRDATVFLQCDVLGSSYSSHENPRSQYTPATYRALQPYFRSFGTNQRIVALSENKPHEVTHRKEKKVGSVELRDVCLRNALLYRYYDQEDCSFVHELKVSYKVEETCTYKLPPKSSSLQRFLRRGPCNPSGPSPNTVIASQSSCPADMTLSDFKALCSIPLGHRIQWQNILVQLRAPAIDLNTIEATYTILQCAHQAGPRGNLGVLRENHEVFTGTRVPCALLEGLDETLRSIGDNWQAHHTLFTLISLACRIHTLTVNEGVQERYLKFLQSARETSKSWLEDLNGKLQKATADEERTELRDRILTNALICAGSYCLDYPTLRDLLNGPSLIEDFLHCSLLIQEMTSPARLSGSLNKLLYRRWQRLSYSIYELLGDRITTKENEPLNRVMQRQWPRFQAASGWKRVSLAQNNWLTTDSMTSGAKDHLAVHFNLLDGELLVNGLPLSRLPSDYESQSMYQVLFGHTAIQVMPTAVPGMRFSAKRTVAGNTLNFGMSSESELLVQAQEPDKRVYELVPRSCLDGCFPISLVQDYVHWYNPQSQEVLFCDQKRPWDFSNATWSLTSTGTDDLWTLNGKDRSLINVRSKTTKVIEMILGPLEDRLHMCGIFDSEYGSIQVELPRLRLGFYLSPKNGRVYSKQYRGMFIDQDQRLGSLVGLRSKIVLRGEEASRPRMVIIPHGTLDYTKVPEHESVVVHIHKSSASRVFAYREDKQLGRLVSDGSMLAQLWICYLHGLTSYSLPDALTSKTGTEQALSILVSAAVKSFDALSTASMELLSRISQMTPQRQYYPAHEQVMQTVKWDATLGFMAQHGGYYRAVKDLFKRHTRYRLFHSDSYNQPPDMEGVHDDLLMRDEIRSSTFQGEGFGAEAFSTLHDVVYSARDQWQDSPTLQRVAAMSKMIHSEDDITLFRLPSSLEDHVWEYLTRHEIVNNESGLLNPDGLSYDGQWLFDDGSYIARNFIKLHLLLSRQPTAINRLRFTMWLCSLAYSNAADMHVLYMFCAFYHVSDSVAKVTPPKACEFALSSGRSLKRHRLSEAVDQHCVPLGQSPEASLPRESRESKQKYTQRQRKTNSRNRELPRDRLLDAIGSQWPCEDLDLASLQAREHEWNQYYNTRGAAIAAESLIKVWHDNRLLKQYVYDLVGSVPQVSHSWHMESPTIVALEWRARGAARFATVDSLFAGPAPAAVHMDPPDVTCMLVYQENTSNARDRLSHLISMIESRAASAYEGDYVNALKASLLSWEERNKTPQLTSKMEVIRSLLQEHQKKLQQSVDHIYTEMLHAVGWSADNEAGCLKKCPRLSPAFFLQQLSHQRWQKLSKGWKNSIVQYALALSFLQQATRRLSLCNDAAALTKDLINRGHTSWNPHDHPEMLLLEVESGITIRDVQQQIAQRIVNTPPGCNQVMQLNMGEGKSSVIVPMIATELADGERLLRVIVGKPQAKQMHHMLVAKLGGMINRPVYRLPFSRDVQPTESNVAEISSILSDCITEGGVLLVQPEHILSFKLMALERIVTGKQQVGQRMLELLEFLNQKTQDVVDESDENFSVKFELIYTLGLQQPIDHSPDRWTCIHDVLDILRKIIPTVHKALPESMEVSPRCPGAFPRTRILKEDAENQVLDLVAARICEVGLCGFPVSRLDPSLRPAVHKYLTQAELTEGDMKAMEESSFWTEQTSKTLLLLRGLLADRVLAFVFAQKRWRVDYGLVHDRKPPTRLAVPYRAKDQPSPRSEFSHPEVVILLTCLSYYYGGLTDDNLFEAFRHLCQSDQADMEYQAWVGDANNLSDSFKQLKGINLEDVFQCTSTLFPCFRYAKATIDYFLSHLVFTKDMKEFPHKLTASGWDLGELKSHPTTGFSGTNDSRVVLPLSVQQLDLPDQMHTNALVLSHLLQPDTHVFMMSSGPDMSRKSDAERLLSLVVSLEDPVRVILDVGAQILELTNLEVARTWLSMVKDDESIEAVVFFDDDDRICVLTRHNIIEPLNTSPFTGQLDSCLVFLDEAHTRGTDLKLPQNYRAAVTLGANLTKDRLVQACMRMRELGKGQSITFCVPGEIEMKVRSRSSHSSEIDVAAILEWAISETWRDMSRNIPVWAMQGRRYQEHKDLWSQSSGKAGGIEISPESAREFLEDEAQSIEARYQRPAKRQGQQEKDDTSIDAIEQRCRQFGALDHGPATFREEQERELSPEIERERQIQRAPPARPLPHRVHPDIDRFIATGALDDSSDAVMPALMAFSETTAAAHMDLSQRPWDLLVSADFAQTVEVEGKTALRACDCFQRSAQWLLTGPDRMVVISPYEAQELLPAVENSKFVCLHLYAARPNLGYRPLDSLDLYTVPARRMLPIPKVIILQLNLFAGQLYFDSFAEYSRVVRYFSSQPRGCRPSQYSSQNRKEKDGTPQLQEDCVKFFKAIFTKVRRDCEGIDKTHMGRLLNDRLLTIEDFSPVS